MWKQTVYAVTWKRFGKKRKLAGKSLSSTVCLTRHLSVKTHFHACSIPSAPRFLLSDELFPSPVTLQWCFPRRASGFFSAIPIIAFTRKNKWNDQFASNFLPCILLCVIMQRLLPSTCVCSPKTAFYLLLDAHIFTSHYGIYLLLCFHSIHPFFLQSLLQP